MDAFEYTIVEKLILSKEDKQKFIQSVQQLLNEGWKPSSDLIINNQNPLSTIFYQALIRITHVKDEN